MWRVEWQKSYVRSHNKSISNYITRVNDKAWKNNNERIKAKNPLLLITRLNYELHDSLHEERALSYIHESLDDSIIITDSLFSQPLSTTSPLLQDMIPSNPLIYLR